MTRGLGDASCSDRRGLCDASVFSPQANRPIARIADQLGHADVSMTARVHLGRDLKGDKREFADVL